MSEPGDGDSGAADSVPHRSEIRPEGPAAVEALGRALARELRSYRVDAVVLWSDPSTAVLAHVVAREVGADVVYAYSDKGILSLSRPVANGARAVLVDYEWLFQPGLLPLLTMLRRTATVTAVLSVADPEVPVRVEDLGESDWIGLAAPASIEETYR
ncbi:hypothetical protein [Rhodococcus sp. NPDC055024]